MTMASTVKNEGCLTEANLKVVLAALDAITQMCMVRPIALKHSVALTCTDLLCLQDDECALKLRLQADGFVALGALMLELSPRQAFFWGSRSLLKLRGSRSLCASLGPHPLLEDDVEGSFECQAGNFLNQLHVCYCAPCRLSFPWSFPGQPETDLSFFNQPLRSLFRRGMCSGRLPGPEPNFSWLSAHLFPEASAVRLEVQIHKPPRS